MRHKAGALAKATMRDFDARHLVVPSKINPAPIKQRREANKISQPGSAGDRVIEHGRECSLSRWRERAGVRVGPAETPFARMAFTLPHQRRVLSNPFFAKCDAC